MAEDWAKRNKTRKNQINREYKARRPDKVRDIEMRSKYGISLADKKQMYVEQKGLCGACGLPLPEDFNKACLDHDHKTGAIRSLLHARCNTLVGTEEKNPALFIAVQRYVAYWKARKTVGEYEQ
jgi:hypothetical protein